LDGISVDVDRRLADILKPPQATHIPSGASAQSGVKDETGGQGARGGTTGHVGSTLVHTDHLLPVHTDCILAHTDYVLRHPRQTTN